MWINVNKKKLWVKTNFALLEHSVLFTLPLESFFFFEVQTLESIHIGNFSQISLKHLVEKKTKKWEWIFLRICVEKLPQGVCFYFFFNIILTLLLHYIHFFSRSTENWKRVLENKKLFNYFPLIKKQHRLKIKYLVPRNILVVLWREICVIHI